MLDVGRIFLKDMNKGRWSRGLRSYKMHLKVGCGSVFFWLRIRRCAALCECDT